MKKALLAVPLLAIAMLAQKRPDPKPATAAPTGISTGLPFYSVDKDTRITIRDLEYERDQLEKDNLGMRLRIAENEAKEAKIADEIVRAASEFAKDKNIPVDNYDFDAATVRFVQKKKP